MNLADKVYVNNKTGEKIRVIDSFENIAILENKSKIDTRHLLNTELFTEVNNNNNNYYNTDKVDPVSFLENQSAYDSLISKIKSLPIDNIRFDEDEQPVQINYNNSNINMPSSNDSAIIMTTEEDERAELARKYGINNNLSNDIERQNQAFAKLLNPEEENVQRIEVNNNVNDVNNNQQEYRSVNTSHEDPIITMFKNVKRSKDFSISLDIKNKIPRPDFIEMMEDSYNTSIIDFLAAEFTDKLLGNPQIIEDMIKEKIKEIVYKNKTVSEKSSSQNQQKPNVVKNNRRKKEIPLEKKEEPKND